MRTFSLPFIENRSHVLGTTTFISLLLHGVLLGLVGVATPALPDKKQEDTGISIDLAMIDYPYPLPAPPQAAKTEAPRAEPAIQDIPQHEPAPNPEPTPVKKPKKEAKRVARKPVADSARSVSKRATLQNKSQTSETNGAAATAVGETAKPIPAGGSSTPSPPYPELARKRGQEGMVNVRCQVDSAGQVTDVSLAKSSGYRLLDEAALQTVRKWKFKPGKKAGINVGGIVIVPVQFKLR